jgi:HK97 family phage prohead protease
MLTKFEYPTGSEFRACTIDIETKDITAKGEWGGYANVGTEIDSYRTRFPKGAWVKSIQERGKIPILDMHQKSVIVGESVRLYEDSKGLAMEGKLYLGHIKRADEMLYLMEQRTVNAMSVSFDLNDIDPKLVKYNRADDCVDIFEANLNEISLVTKNFPSNKGSLITYVRALGMEGNQMESAEIRIAFTRITALLEEILKPKAEEMPIEKNDASILSEDDFNRFMSIYKPVIAKNTKSIQEQFAEVRLLLKKVVG